MPPVGPVTPEVPVRVPLPIRSPVGGGHDGAILPEGIEWPWRTGNAAP